MLDGATAAPEDSMMNSANNNGMSSSSGGDIMADLDNLAVELQNKNATPESVAAAAPSVYSAPVAPVAAAAPVMNLLDFDDDNSTPAAPVPAPAAAPAVMQSTPATVAPTFQLINPPTMLSPAEFQQYWGQASSHTVDVNGIYSNDSVTELEQLQVTRIENNLRQRKVCCMCMYERVCIEAGVFIM